jgi:hypothetical protein
LQLLSMKKQKDYSDMKFQLSDCSLPLEFGLLLPFKKLKINLSSVIVKMEKGVPFKKRYLKKDTIQPIESSIDNSKRTT